eukprot:gene1599-3294_t
MIAVMPIAAGSTKLQINNSHPLQSSDITVAEYGRNAFGATVEPSGPVALLRDSRGKLTLLPAEFCVSRARTPEKPRAISVHGHGTESFSAEHQQQPATDRTVSEVAQM